MEQEAGTVQFPTAENETMVAPIPEGNMVDRIADMKDAPPYWWCVSSFC
jgi:hypothetical protein